MHLIEVCSCLLIFSACVYYSLYRFIVALNQNIVLPHFGDSSSFWSSVILRHKDSQDIEWEAILTIILRLLGWLFLNAAVTELLYNYLSVKVLKIWQIIFSCSAIVHILGGLPLVLLMLQPAIFYVIMYFRFTFLKIWIANVTLLITLNYLKYVMWENWIDENSVHQIHYAHLLIIGMFWMKLKNISYVIDKTKPKMDFLSQLSFCMYLPTMFTGPLILYKEFNQMYTRQRNGINSFTARLKIFGVAAVRYAFWMNFTEICLHYVYINEILYHPDVISRFDLWSLCGYGYAMGQFFHLKYVVAYGLGSSWARLDGIPAPNPPKCIGRIHLYSDMWKYFDVGFYKFIIRYVYIPVAQYSLCRQLFIPTILSFLFVYVWHGLGDEAILVWALFNCFGVFAEKVAHWVATRFRVLMKISNIHENWTTRLTCLLASPLLAMSAVSNFFLFSSADIGYIFIGRIISSSINSMMCLIGILYCCCCVSSFLRQKEKGS